MSTVGGSDTGTEDCGSDAGSEDGGPEFSQSDAGSEFGGSDAGSEVGGSDAGSEVGGSDPGSEVGGSNDTVTAVGLEQNSALRLGSLYSKRISSNTSISLFEMNKVEFFTFITMRFIRTLHWGCLFGL